MPDQFGAGFCRAMNDDGKAGIETAFNKKITRQHGRKRRKLGRFDQDRISGKQSR